MRKMLFLLSTIALLGALTIIDAVADWDPGDGHKMHYPQLPLDMVEPSMNGIDVAFMRGRLADDWQCSESGPVSDIHFWVSWYNNEVLPINQFIVRIWSDNPSGTQGYSIPDSLMWQRIFYPGEYTLRPMDDHVQDWFNPWNGVYLQGNHNRWHQINIANITEPFYQQEGTVYWLEVEMPDPLTIGWKVSGRPHFRDNGVFWSDNYWRELFLPTGEPIDLAFVITTEEMVGCWLCCPMEGNILMDPAGSGSSTVDFDGDFDVDVVDFARFISCMFGPYDPCCDFNCDGVANIADFAIFASHYHHTGTVICHCP